LLDFAGVRPTLPLDGMSLLAHEPEHSRALMSEEFPMQSGVLDGYAEVHELDPATLAQRIERVERGHGYPGKVALFQGDMELVVHRGPNVNELFDLAHDPGAKHDLADGDKAQQEQMRAELARYYARVRSWLGCTPNAQN
jgi:hypothetical protein